MLIRISNAFKASTKPNQTQETAERIVEIHSGRAGMQIEFTGADPDRITLKLKLRIR